MANSSKELEDQFLQVGESLASPPSSVDELYSLLDRIDDLLSRVEQSPSQSMLDALQPLMRALAVREFLRHSDMDVKVAVASCISEITRITAPEAPYDDDIMKDIFQMIVGAFERLDDMSSRSFQKRVSILETVAKVRSCVVMLDLECDALILQMFHHFLRTIRTDHSENVLSSMETIMTLVIEESEDISSDLLSHLLDTLKNDNKDVLPVAQKLAEKVIGACADKLKPYLVELVQTTGAPLNEYNKIVASICQENSDVLDHHNTHASAEVLADDSKLSERTVSDELPQVSTRLEEEVGCPEKVGTAADISLIEVTCNGTVQLENGDSMEQPSSPKQKSERSRRNGQSKNVVSDRADGYALEPLAVKPDGTTDLKKAKGRKKSSSVQPTDTADNSRIDGDKDASTVTIKRKGRSKEAGSSQVDDASAKEVEPAVSLEPEKKNELQQLSGSDNPTSVALPTPVESPPNSVRTKRGRPPGSKAAAKRSDVDAVAEPPASASVQKDASVNSQTHDEVMEVDESKKEAEDVDDGEVPASLTSDSKVKPRRNASKKGRFKSESAEQESSGRKQKSNRKQQKEEDAHENSTKQQKEEDTLGKDVVGEPSLKISSTPDHKKELDAHLVGSKIKVWWPDDKKFYDGVVDSYDSDTKKHKIVYADNDVEVLLLKNERWEFVEGDLGKDGGKQNAEVSQMPRSKKAKTSSNTTSKQGKSQSQSKSGTESRSKDVPRPRGRPRSGTSNHGKLLYDDTPGTSKKSKGKPASDDKTKTPRSNGKLKDEPEEPEDGTPRTSIKREEPGNKSKAGNKSKDVTSTPGTVVKCGTSNLKEKEKEEPPKFARKSKTETPKTSTKSKGDTSKGSSKSGDDTSKSKDSTPKTASKIEIDDVGKNKTSRTNPKTISTPKVGSDSKANGVSNKGKTKAGKSENTPLVSDGEAMTTGRKRKRKGRK